MKTKLVVLALAVLVVSTTGAMALGPVDVEVGAYWWENDLDFAQDSSGAGAPGFRAELWLANRWGLRGSSFKSDPDEGDEVDYRSVDLLARLISPTENSYLAVGAGWETIDTGAGDTSGVRLAAEGRVGIVGVVYAYGQAAYFPDLDDVANAEDLKGKEFEVGLGVNPVPFLHLRGGYRKTEIDYTAGGDDDSFSSDGFYAGVALKF